LFAGAASYQSCVEFSQALYILRATSRKKLENAAAANDEIYYGRGQFNAAKISQKKNQD